MRPSSAPGSVDLGKREFLIRCCQGASATLIPAGLHGLGRPSLYVFGSADTSSSNAEFHLHPHYRMPRPLDAVLLKTQSGLDDFVTEKYADQIAAILARWSSGLLQSPPDVTPIQNVLAPNFVASSPRPVVSRVLRPGPAIEVRRQTFDGETEIGREMFLQEFRSALSGFSKILTAEFQVTSIDATSMDGASLSAAQLSPGGLQTRIRYELVATGPGFYREQRAGYWQITWQNTSQPSASPEFRILRWKTVEETQSRSTSPGYLDITAAALGAMLPTRHNCCTAPTIGARFSTALAASISTGTTASRSATSMATASTIYTSASLRASPTGSIAIAATERSRTSPNRPASGVLENTACALFADFDNDGRQDLIVVRATGPLLFLNQGGGKISARNPMRFNSPLLRREPLPARRSPTTIAMAGSIFISAFTSYYQGTDQYKYPTPYYAAENGPPNFMMRNNRDGTFRDVTAAIGPQPEQHALQLLLRRGATTTATAGPICTSSTISDARIFTATMATEHSPMSLRRRGRRRCRRGHERVLVRLRQRWRRGPLCRQHVDRRRRAHFDAGEFPDLTRPPKRAPCIANTPWAIRLLRNREAIANI